MTKPTYKVFLARSLKQRQRILALRSAGKTMQAIADKLGISRQRVCQVCARGVASFETAEGAPLPEKRK